MEAEKASLREQLVAEVKCVPNNWEDMQEEKTTWIRCWEQKMPAHKQSQQTIAERNDDNKPKGCKKSSKVVGKKAQAGASVAQLMKASKAGPSKWAHDDNNNSVEVVKTHGHGKGKVPVHGGVDEKTAMSLSQALGMVRAKAMAAHAANLCLWVHVKQLAEALAKLGVE
ncbi:hypothetical protein M404DRAFT_32950 [Pisolithus tinctorius Marx 270]|uniref:Uncharacterized protein n=1 Tax=Pisolithus tinctorius Marx 270 TaxID=870435 RepID=A0A0C3JGT9_PISTI|nr:hypothetical protein M404DRAFT_32950 [Pisolithus tinctorius Marx 270]